MVAFSRMSVEELRAYNRDAQLRSRARTRGEDVPKLQRGPRGGEPDAASEGNDGAAAGAPQLRTALQASLPPAAPTAAPAA